MSNLIRILNVDDNDAVHIGVCAYYETLPDLEVVGELTSRTDAIKLVSELIPDSVLLEPNTSDTNGVDQIY